MKLSALLFGLLSLASMSANAQRPYVIHAPSTINQKELYRLHLLCIEQQFGKDQVVESPQGDVLIDLKQTGVIAISHESELLGPVILARELYALSKKHDETTLIPFTELSKVAVAAVRNSLWEQYPRYDVGPNSSFVLTLQFGHDIRSGLYNVSSYSWPSKFGGGPDRFDKSAAFDKFLATKPLALIRNEKEGQQFRESMIESHEGVFYDQTIQLRPKLEVHRRGLEIFESWSQQQQQKIDDILANQVSSDAKWDSARNQRNIRSMEELRQARPEEFQGMVRNAELNYKMLGLDSANQAEDLIIKASIKYGFRFMIMANLEGQNKKFSFGPKG